jgi:hypothetical protein
MVDPRGTQARLPILRDQSCPARSLVAPQQQRTHSPDGLFADSAAFGRFPPQEQNLLLNIGRQVQQIHDLRHPHS